MELKARFDEENNIEWSTETGGCRMSCGLWDWMDLKVHSKAVSDHQKRRGIRSSTSPRSERGNYNEKTARLVYRSCH